MASCDSCGKRPTNNMKKSEQTVIDLCPFNRMADGRAFTDYRNKCQKLTTMNSYDERTYLINNAESIIKNVNEKFVCSSCAIKPNDNSQSTMLPEKFKQVCNKRTCLFELNNENGVGLGR